jgi:hypothetical protein
MKTKVKPKQSEIRQSQCDQIGRIFAYWAVELHIYTVFLKITDVAQIFGVLFPLEKSALCRQKWVWLHFGRFSPQTHGHSGQSSVTTPTMTFSQL